MFFFCCCFVHQRHCGFDCVFKGRLFFFIPGSTGTFRLVEQFRMEMVMMVTRTVGSGWIIEETGATSAVDVGWIEHGANVVLARIERIHHNKLGAFDFSSTERATLSLRFLRQNEKMHSFDFRHPKRIELLVTDLPGWEARRTEEVSARFDPHVLIVFGADLAQLEGGTHLTVELVLLLRHLNVIFRCGRHRPAQIRVHRAPVRVQITIFFKKPKNEEPENLRMQNGSLRSTYNPSLYPSRSAWQRDLFCGIVCRIVPSAVT